MQEMAGKCSAYTVPEQGSVLESFVFFMKENLYQTTENWVVDCFAHLELGNDKTSLLPNSIQDFLLQEDNTESCVISKIESSRLIEFADGDRACRNRV